MKTVEERFWAKVDKNGPNGCWVWLGSLKGSGYGRLKVDSKVVKVHRYSYELFKGTIWEGLTIDHLCRNRACVNPDHLEAVTKKVNILRGISIPAQNAKKTHCSKGHPFDQWNTRFERIKNGRYTVRRCQECRKDRIYQATTLGVVCH